MKFYVYWIGRNGRVQKRAIGFDTRREALHYARQQLERPALAWVVRVAGGLERDIYHALTGQRVQREQWDVENAGGIWVEL